MTGLEWVGPLLVALVLFVLVAVLVGIVVRAESVYRRRQAVLRAKLEAEARVRSATSAALNQMYETARSALRQDG